MMNKMHEKQSVKDLAKFFEHILASNGYSEDLPSIPGLDSYTPSYTSGGTDQGSYHGQLEPDPKRNK